MSHESQPAYLDEHSVEIPAARGEVWRAVQSYAADLSRDAAPWGRIAKVLLGTRPGSGFRVAAEEPERRLALDGEHRFASYRLEFVLADAGPSSTRLTARSFSDWRGRPGRGYGALVVRTGAHALSVRHLLRAVRSRAH